jgi:hypothetical protein
MLDPIQLVWMVKKMEPAAKVFFTIQANWTGPTLCR